MTRDEVRVIDPWYNPNWSPVLQAFFNRRFEFYGRQVRLVQRAIPGDPAGQRAAARAAHDQDRAFASLAPGNGGQAYFDELARLGIVGLNLVPQYPERYLAAHRPYLWTYPMANDRLFGTSGDWYCARFAGRNAVYAGDPLLQSSHRKPGIILTGTGLEGTSAESMNAQLAVCGNRTSAVVESTDHGLDAAYYAAFMENAVLQMKTSGVTTVVLLCNWFTFGVGMRAATNQGYFPEWIVTSYGYVDFSNNIRLFGPSEQTKSLVGLSARPMERAQAEHPSNWAMQEMRDSGNQNDQQNLDIYYRGLLLVASGVQMAGPRLNGESFERGLHQTQFPNPEHRIMAGAVGFGDGDHSMTDDVAEMWWSNSAPTPYPDQWGATGTFCYVDGGARRRIGTFPSDDPFFTGDCDNGAA